MLRIIIIGIVVWAAMLALRRIKHSADTRRKDMNYGGSMVECDTCGVYMPEHDAIALGNGKFRCDRHQ